MAFYDLSSEKRHKIVIKIEKDIKSDLKSKTNKSIVKYFSDPDTYIRKAGYLVIGKIYFTIPSLQKNILEKMQTLFKSPDELIRQTVVNALGEVGKQDAEKALPTVEMAMTDEHHIVRNAVIGSLKKMGNWNSVPVLSFCKKFLHHSDPEVRRQVVHGIELWGRTHPEDVLPLLQEMQNEEVKRVRDVVIHVIGQISYKPGCLEIVINSLKQWENKQIVEDALVEILETHKSYQEFSAKSYKEAKEYIDSNLKYTN